MGMETWRQNSLCSFRQDASSEYVAWKAVTQACFLCILFLLLHVFQVEESRTVMVIFPSSKWKEVDSFQIKLFNSSEIIAALARWWFSSLSSTDKERLSSAPYPLPFKRERHCMWLALRQEASTALIWEILESLVTSGGNWKDHKYFLMTAKWFIKTIF